MQNENEKENDNDNNGGAFGRLVVSLILAIGVICLIGLIANSGEGRMNIPYGEEARDCQVSEERMDSLDNKLRDYVAQIDGQWSVYVKDLRHGLTLSMNNEPMYAASLIKIYVMESTYAHMDTVLDNASALYGENEAQTIVDMLLENMIARSDNDSFNELVRLHSANHSFTEGAEYINAYLSEQGYKDTVIFHTLHPAESEPEAISDNPGDLNETSVKDCGLLLDRIYNNECVSYDASQAMLSLLSMQENDTKIHAGIADAKKIVNKTGETDKQQHDVAIVYTTDRDYILCIMSTALTSEDEEAGVENVKNVASLVGKTLT